MGSDFRAGPATAAFDKVKALKPADAPSRMQGTRL